MAASAEKSATIGADMVASPLAPRTKMPITAQAIMTIIMMLVR